MSKNKESIHPNPAKSNKSTENIKRKPNKISDYQVGDLSTEIDSIDLKEEEITKINPYTGL